MRISRLSALAVMAALALAPAANAMPQDLRSPDARDADAAVHAQTLQDLAHLRAGTSSLAGTTSADPHAAALAQEQYYSSYGKAAPVAHTVAKPDDSSPWPALGIGLGLIVLVAGSVAVAVRTRRRTVRVAV
jgi:hypothetical protein